jgi:exosortase
MTDTTAGVKARRLYPLLLLAAPLAALTWAYWTTLTRLAQAWSTNSSYSHGWLVPLFAGFLLWHRRGLLDAGRLRPSLFGLPLLALGLAMRLVGTYYFFAWLDPLSLLPVSAGIVLLVGGWHGLRWAWPASVFLFFMIPLPFSLSGQLALPLQHLATVCSTYLMQLLGLPALAEGNTILLNEASIGVVEACSGLRMLMVFFALATAVALVIRRPWLDKLILVASAVPIALAVNILRITATGILHEFVNGETANAFFHDVAGWFMMPLALTMLWGEYRLLTRLFLPVQAIPGRTRGAPPRKALAPRPERGRPALPPAQRGRQRAANPQAVRKP